MLQLSVIYGVLLVCAGVANKTGYCPIEDGKISYPCWRECYDDADCAGVSKCCERGCSQLCLEPSAPTIPPLSSTYAPGTPQVPPSADVATATNIAANEGGKATLPCLFHGNPPPIITWRKGEITINGNADRYMLLSDGTLEIASLYRSNSGVYICIAENHFGRATQEVRLEVNVPVNTSISATSTRLRAGSEINLKCEIDGYPVPDVYWTKDGARMSSNVGQVTEARVKLAHATTSDSGVYGCHASNAFSSHNSIVQINVEDITINKVDLQCDEYIAECSGLRCEYAVQRVQTSGGCVQCSCISVKVNCSRPTSECESLRCAHGTERYTGEDGCERCRCLDHPCSGKECPSGERCITVPYDDTLTKQTRYHADCRVANKTGYCPIEDRKTSTENQCRRECYDDADCVGVGKCCERGCSQLCLGPIAPTIPPLPSTYAPGTPQAPSADVATVTSIAANEGGKATLRCLFHGNPLPIITWRKGEITINGNANRYMLLEDGTLEIASLYRNDSGVYICIAENHLGRATQEIRLEVNDPVDGPAGIAGVPNRVMFSELDTAFNLSCLAYGNPEPLIVWYRGNRPIVPYSSSLYEARENILQIRRINSETLGEYICEAYNGIGEPAEQMFTVQAYRPDGPDDFPHMAPQTNEVHVTPRQVLTEATTTVKVVYTVPVNTSISATSIRLRAGSEINLKCEIDGFPVPDVYWTKDGARISSNDRMLVTEARVTLAHAATSDSGVYGCHASNAFSSHNSIVQINVEGIYIPPSCKDNPYFVDCSVIVRIKFCRHKYYSGGCCQSCAEAGLLDPMQIDMQADQGWYKRK